MKMYSGLCEDVMEHVTDDVLVCKSHGPLLRCLQEIAGNILWVGRIGKWLLGVIGASLVVIVPLLVALFIFLSNLDKQVAINSTTLQKLTIQIEKHIDRP